MHAKITAPPARMVTSIDGDTPTPRARGRLTVPMMRPVDETCGSCRSSNVVTIGKRSSEGPSMHCRTCGTTTREGA